MFATEPGASVQIRPAKPDDAAALLDLKLALDGESTFMMFERDERNPDPEGVEQDIRVRSASPNSTLIVAVSGDEIVGYVEATGGEFRRNHHSAMIIAGVRATHAGQGIGSRLFQALIDWAEDAGLIRLELTVMAHNRAARRLYEKFGFVEEGVRTCSLRVDGACVDEVAMARVRPDFAGSDRNG